MAIKLKRGPEVTIQSLQVGEPGFTTDSKKLFIGSNAGNIEIGGDMEHLVPILWADLKALRDASLLTPGQQYRIADYITTTTQLNTQSASHQFDIIVTADAVNKLNENARACLHAGDTYFADSKLEAWKLKYCLDNDTSRFAWADEVNGKGVIYRMIDEFDNDCPYDFKNIQFKKASVWYHTFGNDLVGNSYGNKISVNISSNKATLNAITFGYNCHSNTFGSDCYSNTFGNYCSSNLFGDYCYQNTFGDYCSSNTFGDWCSSNTFGDWCSSNTLGNECQYLKISDSTETPKKCISVDGGLIGASGANQFDLYDSSILNKNYQVTFKKSAGGKYLMLWATDTGTMIGKVKDDNIDTTWADIV